MQERRIVIDGPSGTTHIGATLLCCSNCQCESFYAYIVDGTTHPHFQCYDCGSTFCDNLDCIGVHNAN